MKIDITKYYSTKNGLYLGKLCDLSLICHGVGIPNVRYCANVQFNDIRELFYDKDGQCIGLLKVNRKEAGLRNDNKYGLVELINNPIINLSETIAYLMKTKEKLIKQINKSI